MTSCINIHSATLDGPWRNLVMCLIPLLLYQLYVLLGEGLIICRILFLKVLRLLKKKLCLKWKQGLLFDVKTGHIVGKPCDARVGL